MVRTALLALALALGGGGAHFGVLLDLVSTAWAAGPVDAIAKAGGVHDPNGAPATGDAGNGADPNGTTATSDAGGHADPNG